MDMEDMRHGLLSIMERMDGMLEDALDIRAIARGAGFSYYHFCHLFHGIVGMPIGRYIRMRRLAHAAHALSGDQKVIDIAMRYGFETHSGFSKAFKRQYGCSPEVYRMHARADVPPPPAHYVKKKMDCGGIVMEPTFEKRPATRIAGYVLRTRTENGENRQDIPAFWQQYMNSGMAQKLHGEAFVTSHDEYGACFMEEADGAFDYIVGVRVEEDAQVPEGYAVRTIPEAQYAVFRTPEAAPDQFVSSIQRTWTHIFEEWFPKSPYEYADGGVDYERYDDASMGDETKSCEICIPIQQRSK